MFHLRREIDLNQQLVAYRLCTTKITNVQEWILEELGNLSFKLHFL